jgi:hypothetical protein
VEPKGTELAPGVFLIPAMQVIRVCIFGVSSLFAIENDMMAAVFGPT